MIPASPLVVSTVRHTAGIVTQLLGLAALAALLAVGAAIVSRRLIDQRVPRWLAVLVGLVPVILYLATTPALESVLREGITPTEVEVGLFNLGGVLAGAGGALAGRRVGDQFCRDVLFWTPTQNVDDGVSDLAQTVGQVTTVTLPPSVDDAIGYDPVPQRTKEDLAGTTFVFPRALTTDDLRERLAERLTTDYGVETVDAEFDGDRVTYLAVGRRAAGIGSTLPAATNAVAVRADPAFSASTGDIVQVWEPERMRRVLTGELRGVADDVVTVAIDATDTPKVDPRKRYRLVTLPVEDRPDREFASLLRAASETFSSAAVEAGSPLHGMLVGALDLTVVAVRPEETEPVVFPEGSYRLAPGDRLFVIGTAPQLRYLEQAGEALDPSVVGPPPSIPTDGSQPAEAIETESVSPADEKPSEEPARIGSETGIERDSGSSSRDGPAEAGAGGDEPASASEAPAPGEGASPSPADTGESASAEGAGSSQFEGKADEATFEEIKAEFDEAEADEGSPGDDSGSDPAETAASSDEVTDIDPDTASFEDLRDEFETGEADWDEEEDEEGPFEDVEIAFEDEEAGAGDTDSEPADDDDDLVSLDEAEITFEDDAEAEDDDENPFEADAETGESTLGDPEIDEDLQGEDEESLAGDLTDLDVAEEEETDDLTDLEIEEDEDDGLFADDSLEDDDLFGDDEAADDAAETDDDDEMADEDDEMADEDAGDDDDDDEDDEGGASSDDDDDGGGGGGNKSFAELKEEFESGDAEWEDDVSDSPGGDMRLDE